MRTRLVPQRTPGRAGGPQPAASSCGALGPGAPGTARPTIAGARVTGPLACLALLLLLAVSCGRTPQPKNLLATVGDRQILTEDLLREAERRQKARQRVPDKAALLEQMVEQEAMLARARALGVDQDPQTRREIALLLVSKLRDRELGPRLKTVEVTAEEVEAAYRADIAKYTRPAKVRLAALVLKGDPASSAAKRDELQARLEDARRQVLAQPPAGGRGAAATGFGALAVNYSDDPATRHRGGDLGWVDPGNYELRWPRPVLEAGYRLAKGEVSEVLAVGSDFYLVTKSDERPESVTPLADVQAALRQTLLTQKRRQIETAFEQELLSQIGVTLHAQNLANVTLPEPPPTMVRTGNFEPPTLMGGNDSSHGN